jgi:hypothetical protein
VQLQNSECCGVEFNFPRFKRQKIVRKSLISYGGKWAAGSLNIRASFKYVGENKMHFIETSEGLRIPYSEIVEIERCGKRKTIIKTKGRKKHVVLQASLQANIENVSAPVIPSLPGYSVIFAIPREDASKPWSIFALEVIGWRIKTYFSGAMCESEPILAGTFLFPDFWAIIYPDGKLSPQGALFRFLSKEEWLESIREEWEQRGHVLDDSETDDANYEDDEQPVEDQDP